MNPVPCDCCAKKILPTQVIVCETCQQVRYCEKSCQLQHSLLHRDVCKRLPVGCDPSSDLPLLPEPEPDFGTADHAYNDSWLWPEISSSFHSQANLWVRESLAYIWKGNRTMTLVMTEHPGTREYSWIFSGVEIVCSKTDFADAINRVCQRFSVPPLPNHSIGLDEKSLQKQQWIFRLSDGAITGLTRTALPKRVRGKFCRIAGCTNAVVILGWLRNYQLAEKEEMQVLQGKWTSAGGSGVSATVYYCQEHAECSKAEGWNPELPCRGPLGMVTTKLVWRDLVSPDELDGKLFCIAHSPAGPRHMIFTKRASPS